MLVFALGGAPALALGLIEGVSDAAAAFCKLAGGRLADRLGRLKPATAAGYVVTGVAIPAIGLATAWWQMLVLRTIGWCGRGLRNPMRDTLLVRSIPEGDRGRAFGVERAMDQAGAVLAPLIVIAMLRAGVSVQRVVLWAIVPGLLAALALIVLVRERAGPGSGSAAPAPDSGPATATFRKFLTALFVFGAGDFAKTLLVLWAFGQSLAIGAGSGYAAPILLYAGFNAVTVVAALAGGRASDAVGRKPVLVFGYAIGALAAAVPVFVPASLGAGAAALALSGILVGIEEAVERAWAADLAPQGRHGRAFGRVHAVNGVGDLVASVLVGGLWEAAGPPVAFGAAAVLMAAGTLMIARIR
jgi:MFS family permease